MFNEILALAAMATTVLTLAAVFAYGAHLVITANK